MDTSTDEEPEEGQISDSSKEEEPLQRAPSRRFSQTQEDIAEQVQADTPLKRCGHEGDCICDLPLTKELQDFLLEEELKEEVLKLRLEEQYTLQSLKRQGLPIPTPAQLYKQAVDCHLPIKDALPFCHQEEGFKCALGPEPHQGWCDMIKDRDCFFCTHPAVTTCDLHTDSLESDLDSDDELDLFAARYYKK